MKLIYNKEYLSVSEFKPIELPNFTIFTGLNGSGKTHFLQAIKRGNVIVEGVNKDSIVYFDNKEFYLNNESTYNTQIIADQRNEAWVMFTRNFLPNLLEYKNIFLGTDNIYQELIDISERTNTSLYKLDKDMIEDVKLLEALKGYRTRIEGFFAGILENKFAHPIRQMIEHFPRAINEITEIEFMSSYLPLELKNKFIPNQLGQIFLAYQEKINQNILNRANGNMSALSDEEFIKRNGEAPWLLIDRILESFGDFDIRVNNPAHLNLTDRYMTQLILRKKGIEIGFDSLSSGEKTLLALAASIYNADHIKTFPRIILLDEIDASLHPSMIQQLLNGLQKISTEFATEIILVTHSPSTVALAPDDSVFTINTKGRTIIEKRNQAEALNILTEGFATLQKGIELFDLLGRKKISIITEGWNTRYIEKAIKLLAPELIHDVEIITGAEGNSGKNQLRTIYDFFTRVKHKNNVLIVWDCDYQVTELQEMNGTIPFILPRQADNTIAQKGIENMFSPSLFKEDILYPLSHSLSKDRKLNKNKFLDLMMKNGKGEDFQNFQLLIKKIREVLSKSDSKSAKPYPKVDR